MSEFTLRLAFACSLAASAASGEPVVDSRGSGVFVDNTDHFASELAARAAAPDGKAPSTRPAFKASVAGLAVPASPSEFRQVWHHEPVLQGLTGQCWAFASTSFFESEIHRCSGREIRLSEMFTVYWEFVEKARRFVAERGNSEFGRGSEPNATIRIWRQYGIVPHAAYSGLLSGRDFHDDRRAFAEMRAYLTSVRERGDWDEARAVAAIRSILDRYLGPPPARVEVDGEAMSPREYLRRVVRLDLDNYISVVSCLQEPFDRWCEYDAPDNWWHSREYYNVPLVDFVRLVRDAARGGQSLCLAGDNTEPGFLPRLDVAIVPSFDIPSAAIDDSARQLRFVNGSSADDHVVHLVGGLEKKGDRWYLIKDSDTKPRNGHHQGYMFYHEDYVKLKTLAILLPRDFAEKSLGRSLK